MKQKTGLFSIPTGNMLCFVIMKQLIILFLVSGISNTKIFAQDYFQQKVNYSIQVSLDDLHHEINGFEHLIYSNQSPDTLRFLYFHLWPNAYSDNDTPLAKQLFLIYGKQKLFNDPKQRGYIDSLAFEINGRQTNWSFIPEHPDIAKISLNDPLLPGDSIEITTPFRVKIPEVSVSRFGHSGNSYQISQWYPKPAVYDKKGWHPMSYLDQGEFYSEFGNYNVQITLPENYIVGATGELQNKRELELFKQMASDTAWMQKTVRDENQVIPSSKSLKTINFSASNVHDFAWFASKQFHVLEDTMKLPHSGRIISIRALFPSEQAALWKNALKYIKGAILFYSENVGDYPYNSYTAVQAELISGQGMEYPGLSVIAETDDAYALDEVLVHEIGHSWFYAALGSNERQYPFMDESITSAYTQRYMQQKYPDKKLWQSYLQDIKKAEFFHIDQLPIQREQEYVWLIQANNNLEQPVNSSSESLSISNYDIMIYNKGAWGFNYLRAYLSDSVFDSIMNAYFQKWKFRHPQPNDLYEVFESYTDKNLSWFFDDFLGTTKHIDYKMKRLDQQQLLVKNKGELASPFLLTGMKDDSTRFEKWIDGFENEKSIEIPNGDYTELKIDPYHLMPEINRLNNNMHTSGIFRKADPVRFQLLFTVNDPEKHTIMFIPSMNWTQEDRLMAGFLVHNGSIIPKKIEYLFVPFYSFHSSSLVGFSKVSYRFIPYSKILREGTVNFEGTRFGAPGNQKFFMLKTGIDLIFGSNDTLRSLQHELLSDYIAASDLMQIVSGKNATSKNYVHLGYKMTKSSVINPFSVKIMLEYNPAFQKLYSEIKYRLSYRGKQKGLNFRLFAGTMFKEDVNRPYYSLAAAGRNGVDDYLFRGTFPDRFNHSSSDIWPRQMLPTEGGLISPVNMQLGYSKKLLSLTITSDLPGLKYEFPIKPFATVLLNDHGYQSSDPEFFAEAGIKTGIWNLFEFYIPLLVTNNIKTDTGSVRERIRFVFSLDTISKIGLKQKDN